MRAELIIHLEYPVSIRMRSRFPPPSSLNELEDVLHEEWYSIPLETIQNIYEYTDHINANEMQLFYVFYLVLKALHVADTLCVHHQEHYKL